MIPFGHVVVRPQYVLSGTERCIAVYDQLPNAATRLLVSEALQQLPHFREHTRGLSWEDTRLVVTGTAPVIPLVLAVQISQLLNPHKQAASTLLLRPLEDCELCQGKCMHWRLDIGMSVPFRAPRSWRGWRLFDKVKTVGGGFITGMWARCGMLSGQRQPMHYLTNLWVPSLLNNCGLFSPGFAALQTGNFAEPPQ